MRHVWNYCFVLSLAACNSVSLAIADELSASSGSMAAASPAGGTGDSGATADSSGSGELQEVIVTANRRAENVEKVPISIAVLSGDDLAAAGLTNFQQLTYRTTNLQMGNINGQPLIYIRGMGSAILNPGAEGTVGIYMDGIYLPWAASIDQSVLDVERVEVLKGPQGSLYGRNTTAGAINFITRDPAAARVAEGSVTVGSHGTQNVSVFLASGPGAWSASIAGQSAKHDPFIHNLSTGPDYQDRNEQGFRGALKYQPNELWSVIAHVDFNERHDHYEQGFISINDRLTAANPANPGKWVNINNDPNDTYGDYPSLGESFKDIGGSVTVRVALPFADFVSLSGARDTHTTSSPETDASSLPLTGFSSKLFLKSWSQELQLNSNPGTNLVWNAGAYAFRSNGGFDPVGVFNPSATTPPTANINAANLLVTGLGAAKAYALYAQASYTLFDHLKLTGGARYSWEQREDTNTTVILPGVGTVFSQEPLHKSWHATTPKAGIDYSWGSQLLYASYTKGFRSGSYNISSVGTPGPVNPEYVKAFEIGGKHAIWDRVQFDWALFHSKYADLQVSRELNNGSGSLFFIQNAASATIKGAEASLNVRAIDNLVIDLGIGYTNAKYDNFANAEAFLQAPSGYGYVPGAVDASGRPLARAPKLTASLAATYTIPVGTSNLDLSGNLYHTSSYYLDVPSNVLVDSYSIVNARVTYYLPGESHVSVAAYVNNAFDKRYLNTLSTSQDALFGTPNDPRIYGVTVAIKY
jgi:iron complex outermembrane receptor protein